MILILGPGPTMLFTLDTLPQASTARLAVIGHPVSHSRSPAMHQAALDEEQRDCRYIALEVPPGRVGEAFARMRELGFIGCNVTVPHKFEALEACDEIDDLARDFAAVNTVRFDADTTRATNTDGYGFEQAVAETLGLSLSGLRVMIVGAGGGAGSAIATHCARAGVKELLLVNRTVSKIEALSSRLRQQHPGITVNIMACEAMGTLDADLIVNTTSLGLRADDPSPLPVHLLTSRHAVFDTIYHPTALIEAASRAGARHANGSLMLLHQGIAAYRFWFPGSHPEAAMRRGLGV
ncbi:MAG: shikimate dehydrogenase [Verrucomicrobiota bacterium]